MPNVDNKAPDNRGRALNGTGWFIGIAAFLLLMTIQSWRVLDKPFPFEKASEGKIFLVVQVGCILICAGLIRTSGEIQERVVLTICALEGALSVFRVLAQPSPGGVRGLRLGRLVLWAIVLSVSLLRHPSKQSAQEPLQS